MIQSVKLVILVISITAVSCGGGTGSQTESDSIRHQKVISKIDYGNDWPFSVESGTLICDRSAILFLVNNKKYAVNGTAKNWATSEGYVDQIEDIWLPGTDIGQIIRDGQKLCD